MVPNPISLIMNMTVATIWWVFTHLPFLTPNRENLKELLIGKAVILTAMTSCTATFTRNFRNVMLSITSMTVEAIRSSRKTANNVPAENGAFPFPMNLVVR